MKVGATVEKMKALRQLRRENHAAVKGLNPEDQVILGRILNAMELKNVNDLDGELIRRDLIGMAMEQEMRSSDLQAVIGESADDFCLELIQSAGRRSAAVRLLNSLALFLFLAGVFLIPELIQARQQPFSGYTLLTVAAIALYSLFRHLVPLSGSRQGLLLFFFLLFFIFVLPRIMTSGLKEAVLFSYEPVLAAVGMLILWLICVFAKYYMIYEGANRKI